MILLDTHAWVWWVAGDPQLSRRARAAIEGTEWVGVSPISCYEVARLVARGRIAFDRDVEAWLREALARPTTSILDATTGVLARAALLGDDMHGDPIDRILVATAIDHEAVIVTKDHRIREYRGVESVW